LPCGSSPGAGCLAGVCTGCSQGWLKVPIKAGYVCAPDFPLWGVAPDNRSLKTANGAVTDAFTGLQWQQQHSATSMIWSAAFAFCQSASTGGHGDWRLPTRSELQSLAAPGEDQLAGEDLNATGSLERPVLDPAPAPDLAADPPTLAPEVLSPALLEAGGAEVHAEPNNEIEPVAARSGEAAERTAAESMVVAGTAGFEPRATGAARWRRLVIGLALAASLAVGAVVLGRLLAPSSPEPGHREIARAPQVALAAPVVAVPGADAAGSAPEAGAGEASPASLPRCGIGPPGGAASPASYRPPTGPQPQVNGWPAPARPRLARRIAPRPSSEAGPCARPARSGCRCPRSRKRREAPRIGPARILPPRWPARDRPDRRRPR
jgi:hypothetical protein